MNSHSFTNIKMYSDFESVGKLLFFCLCCLFVSIRGKCLLMFCAPADVMSVHCCLMSLCVICKQQGCYILKCTLREFMFCINVQVHSIILPFPAQFLAAGFLQNENISVYDSRLDYIEV